MICLTRTITIAILGTCLALANLASADATTAARLAVDAKEALDAYYGNQKQLALAAQLLTRALAESEADATIYVQAARLTIKGGHVVATQFQPGTIDAYGELLDRALSLDPNNSKAHILKAEYFHIKGLYAEELAELDKAKGTGTADAWLPVGYGRWYRRIGDANKAIAHYSDVRTRGPGTTVEQRNAYVAALGGLAGFAAAAANETELRELVDATRKGRDSRDAWALGNLAEDLVRAGMFDDAIAVAREALQTMDYDAGRLTLTAALFGKAAELTVAGRPLAAAPLADEARAYGYGRTSVLRRFNFRAPKVARLFPTLDTLLE